MEQNTLNFIIDPDTKGVFVSGFPELEGREGTYIGEGMAMFWGTDWHDYELFITNTRTGKIRKLTTKGGTMLVDDSEIDFELIEKKCRHGYVNAKNKNVRYARINRYDCFENGICAISWVLYPDGRYFEDSDGFGGEDNDEECVYAIINTNLDIIIPFRPVENIKGYLNKIRSDYGK